jgi:hypothetical protein
MPLYFSLGLNPYFIVGATIVLTLLIALRIYEEKRNLNERLLQSSYEPKINALEAIDKEVSVLSLDNEKWKLLSPFFGEPEDLPLVLGKWLSAIGSKQEINIYRDDLFDLFLHQVTITNAAFAVVPFLVAVCKKGDTKFQIEYLTDVALVEANRLKYGVYGNREGTEKYPEWLMSDYTQAILEARNLVDGVIMAEQDENNKTELVAMKPALFGNADLAWSHWRGQQ